MKLVHPLLLMSAAMLQPNVCFAHEARSGSAPTASTINSANSASANLPALSCPMTQAQPAVAAAPTAKSVDAEDAAGDLGHETYRVVLAALATMLFLNSRRKRDDRI
jgi:hypothetical protein